MRILMVSKVYSPVLGGVENYLRDLIRVLGDRCSITVLTSHGAFRTVRESIDGVNVIKAGSLGNLRSNPISPFFTSVFEKVLRKYGPFDVVNLHLPNPTAMWAYWRVSPPGKLVLSWHGDIIRQRLLYRLVRPLERAILGRADLVLATTRAYLETSEPLRNFASKTRICPYFIDFEAINSVSPTRPENAPEKRDGERWVCSVSRLVDWKGVQILIRAMPHLPPHYRALVVGKGPYAQTLKRLANETGCAERIHFLGQQSMSEGTLQWCLKQSDVFSFSSLSRNESFGIAQLEAMAFGLPIIASDIYGGKRALLLEPERTGTVVPVGDPRAHAEAIRRFAEDPALLEEAARRGREIIETTYTPERCAKLYLELLSELFRQASGDLPLKIPSTAS